MINVDFKMFLDRPHVMQRVSAKQRKVFGRSGGFGRQVMRRQMRPGGKKRKSSEPGQPPRTRVGLLKKLIYFGVDPNSETVVIGPELTHGAKKTQALGGQTVPELLDEGGRASLVFPDGNQRIVEYLPRPFVDPVRPTVEEFYEKMIKETPL